MTNDVGTQFYIDDSDVKDTNLVSSCWTLFDRIIFLFGLLCILGEDTGAAGEAVQHTAFHQGAHHQSHLQSSIRTEQSK
jgi:hypothetical protein